MRAFFAEERNEISWMEFRFRAFECLIDTFHEGIEPRVALLVLSRRIALEREFMTSRTLPLNLKCSMAGVTTLPARPEKIRNTWTGAEEEKERYPNNTKLEAV